MNAPVRVAKDAGIWARQGEDWYVEPEWCSRRLFETEDFSTRLYDPACGMGRIVDAALACGIGAHGTDIVPRREGRLFGCDNYLQHHHVGLFKHIVSNPPFDKAEDFARKAIRETSGKVALLLPATWHCGDKRSRWLETTPLRKVLFLTPRPSMPPGHVILAGEKVGGGTKDFAWFIWEQSYSGKPEFGWLRRDCK